MAWRFEKNGVKGMKLGSLIVMFASAAIGWFAAFTGTVAYDFYESLPNPRMKEDFYIIIAGIIISTILVAWLYNVLNFICKKN